MLNHLMKEWKYIKCIIVNEWIPHYYHFRAGNTCFHIQSIINISPKTIIDKLHFYWFKLVESFLKNEINNQPKVLFNIQIKFGQFH